MANDPTTPAIQHLRERGIAHRVFAHTGPVNSLEQAAAERQQRPEQVVRSIVFRIADGEFVMVLVAGPGQIPWKALRRYLGQNRLTMATEEELLQVTGCVPGSVSPLGLPRPMRILIDQKVLDPPEISLGSCRRGLAIILKPADLLAAIDSPEIVNLTGQSG